MLDDLGHIDDDPLIGAQIGAYRVDERIARGGMGVVYRGEDVRLGRPVAIKVVAPELARDAAYRIRFEREARAAAQIDHPNVVSIYAELEERGLMFIVMQYIEGGDLALLLEREGALEAERAARIVAQTGAALDAAHRAGLVHRDVKPANLLLRQTDDGEHVFVTDFGLARAAAASRSGLTHSGAVLGTLDFIAPEQISGEGTTDGRADIYALGCVLYYTLSGEVPFPRESQVAKMHAHLNAAPPTLGDTRFDPIIARAMAKDPEQRYASAGELGRAALDAVGVGATLSGIAFPGRANAADARDEAATEPLAAPTVPVQPPPAPPTPPPTPPAARRRRQLPIAAVAAVLALLVVSATAFAVLGRDTREPEPTPEPIASAEPPRATTEPVSSPAPTSTPDDTPEPTSTPDETTEPDPTPGPEDLNVERDCGDDITAAPHTTCRFANNVVDAYNDDEYQDTTLDVYSPVTKQTYSMDCERDGDTVTCNGDTASVTFPYEF